MQSMQIGMFTDNFKFVAGVIGDEHSGIGRKMLETDPCL